MDGSSGDTRTKRRRSSIEDRRTEVVDTAAQLFRRKGYALTTMEDIAEVIGIAKPTLYHYFNSKEAILALIHRRINDVLHGRWESRAALGLTSEQALFEMIVDILELSESHPDHQRVWVEHYRELPPEELERRDDSTSLYVSRMSDAVQRCIADGIFRSDLDVVLTTRQITGMCTWAYDWLPDKVGYRARDVAFVFWGNLTNGLNVSPTPPDAGYSVRDFEQRPSV
jgi:AcrR family transcriptional regulator